MSTASWIPLNREDKVSLATQIYARIKTAIQNGTLQNGARLPSTRALASELNVSRNTVEIAYEMLNGEGIIQGKGSAGSFVNHTRLISDRREVNISPRAASTDATNEGFVPSSEMHFHPCVPSFDLFPTKLWNRLTHRRLRQTTTQDLAMGHYAGYWDLRVAICSYLQLSRGVSCLPEQVFITRGFQGALDLITRTLLEPGDAVILEDPGYRYARNLFIQSKMNVLFAPVDTEGLNIPWIQNNIARSKLISVTPSHQSPTGVMLSHARRVELLELAKHRGTWILEDDYDSEYRYVGKPLPSLKSLDAYDQVIYAGTFSKVLFPAIRTGYMVVPLKLVPQFDSTAQIFQSGCSTLTQMVIYDFMTQGHFSRHIRKMRGHYKVRRKWLTDALTASFEEGIQIALQKNGMHLIVRPNINIADAAMAEIARKAGYGIHALSEWSVHSTRQGLLLGFANIKSPDEANRLVSNLRRLLISETAHRLPNG